MVSHLPASLPSSFSQRKKQRTGHPEATAIVTELLRQLPVAPQAPQHSLRHSRRKGMCLFRADEVAQFQRLIQWSLTRVSLEAHTRAASVLLQWSAGLASYRCLHPRG
eukprot:TRINITY_DN15804_c0_g1_i1.p2 TRINITY_DN15804_c0_g1~~TRINITY_DN15804_c0_g1_i1.p2  ORF type:complete len:108 (+),score=7.32 TRINITY_DN15804_c0_g1_i1:42-365(+)